MSIKESIVLINSELPPTTKLVAVSKFHPVETILEAYDAGQRLFGESRPQELKSKSETLPNDIEWHFIGHLQTNKIKMVVPYATLIHSVDSLHLLREIDNYCSRNDMTTQVLLQLHIASEETKQGFSQEELFGLFDRLSAGEEKFTNVRLRGVMGMASLTDDEDLIRAEFANLVAVHKYIHNYSNPYTVNFDQLSFGMSSDYKIAIEMGSTLVRIGTSIFGIRS